jgi:ribosome biogenesis protein BRX1
MASVYKSISKKKKERPVAEEVDGDEEDIAMEDLLDDEDMSNSDEDEDEDEDPIEELDDGSKANGEQQARDKSGFMPKTRILMLTSRGVTHR